MFPQNWIYKQTSGSEDVSLPLFVMRSAIPVRQLVCGVLGGNMSMAMHIIKYRKIPLNEEEKLFDYFESKMYN